MSNTEEKGQKSEQLIIQYIRTLEDKQNADRFQSEVYDSPGPNYMKETIVDLSLGDLGLGYDIEARLKELELELSEVLEMSPAEVAEYIKSILIGRLNLSTSKKTFQEKEIINGSIRYLEQKVIEQGQSQR